MKSRSPSEDKSSTFDPDKPAKFDSTKVRLELVPPELVYAAGRAMTYGAIKYAPHNWSKPPGLEEERLMGAVLRHLFAYQSGELIDNESGLSHLDHAAAALGMLLGTKARYPKERKYETESVSVAS